MADTFTTNLNLTKPGVGATTNTEVGKINNDLDAVDGIFAANGDGTSVGLNVGSGKTLTIGGTLDINGTIDCEAELLIILQSVEAQQRQEVLLPLTVLV